MFDFETRKQQKKSTFVAYIDFRQAFELSSYKKRHKLVWKGKYCRPLPVNVFTKMLSPIWELMVIRQILQCYRWLKARLFTLSSLIWSLHKRHGEKGQYSQKGCRSRF